MVEIIGLTLENEMDLILSHKKAMRVGEKLKLAISTQSTFATAVAEICREVIEKTDQGVLSIGVKTEGGRYSLAASIRVPEEVNIDSRDEGFLYAKRLLPQIQLTSEKNWKYIELSIGLPRSAKIDPNKLEGLILFFAHEEPYTPYEEIKTKNRELLSIAEERYEELLQSKFINDKKNEFISIASHELKTPVTIIKAYSQIALSASGADKCSDKVAGYLNRIDMQTTRLQSLIQQLLDVSKIENGRVDYKMEEIQLNSYLEDTLSLIRHTIPTYRLNIMLGDDAWVKVDKFRMEQVLSNIIGNAAKYSPDNNVIEFRTKTLPDSVLISVKDHGVGMPEKDITKIFEKFHRNEEVAQRYSGMGMGLYITSRILKDHGGKIWAESKEGLGSTFHFTLPVGGDK